MRHPNLYIISGPNGAGKTTASICDSVLIFDNTKGYPKIIAELQTTTRTLLVHNHIAWTKISEL